MNSDQPIDLIQINTTGDDRSVLQEIARILIESKLAACCQLEGPVQSTYCWEGATETADEYRLVIKTRRDLYSAAEKMIMENHTYDQPQITSTPIEQCHSGYAAWVLASTQGIAEQ